MTAPRINALRSLRLWLPIFLMLTAGGGGAILYFTEASVHQTKFENEFKADQILRTARLQSEVERWVQRNDPEMVESVFAEMGIVPELKTALFLNASNQVLAASRRADIGAPLEIQTLARDQQDQARLTDAMQTTRQTKRSQALFTSGRDRLVICQPTSVPLRAGELETAQAGLIVVSYDLTLDKAASLQHVQGEFLIYFASLLFIALLLGVSVHFLVTRRLEWLKARMGEFAAGQPLPRSPARLGDEITYLCDRFDEMATSVSREMAERQGAEAKIRRLNAELEDRVRQRTGQLEATLKEVESFAYSLSHDLRGPLRHIAGYSHILLEDAADKLDAEERKNLQSVRRAANRMAQLLDDLLSLLQVTRSQVHRSPTDLSALAAAVAGEFRQAQPERKVRVVIAPGLKVEADPQQLRIVLTHLLGNAWKFTSQQPAALIEVGVLQPADPPVYFIRDNGAGFDMAYAGKLFGAFQRLHKDTEFSGTGIGLAIAQRIIQRHGGRIWAEGEAGKGATFYFTLPNADAPRETEPQLVAGVAQDISERKQAEQQLALLSFALNQVREAAFLIDEKACFRFVNEEACRALGYTREELLKRGVPDVDPDFPKAQWDGHWKELRARHSMNFEGRHQTKSGRIFPVEVNANYLEYGGQAYNLALVRDITERKRSQEAAAQEQARLKFIFDALPIGICLNRKQRDGSETRLINDAHLRIAGIRREQDQMDTWLRISHPADRQRQAELNRQIEEGKRQHFSMDKRYVQPDGRIVWVLFSLQRRKLDDGGIEELTTVVDITERKQAEEKVGHLAAIVESTDDAVIGKTLDEKIVSWNKGAEQVYGYTADEMVGQSISVLVPAERRDELKAISAKLKSGEKIQHFETVRRRKDGQPISVALTISPIKDASGQITGASIIARDITERKRMADLLHQRAQEFQALVENSPDIIARYDRDCRRIYVNPAFLKAAGIKEDQLLGIPPTTLSPLGSEAAAALENLIRRVVETGRPGEVDLQMQTPDRRQLWYAVNVIPEVDRAGQVASVMSISRDITARKQAEEALRQAGNYNRRLIEASLDPLVTIGPDGKITDVNTATETATGRARAELVGTDFSDYFTEPETARAGYQQVFREGFVKDYALELRHRDGRVMSVLYNASVYRDERGEASGVFAAARDVTERKRAEAALEESEKSFRTLAESVPQVVWATRADGWNIYFNQRWMDYTGMTLEESHGHGWNKPFHPEDQKRAWEAWQEATQHDKIYSLEARLRRADGVYRWWLVRGAPLRDADGKITKWFGTCTDIHDLKAAEEEIRKLNAELEQRVRERTQELAESEARFRAIYNMAPVSIWQEDWTAVIAMIRPLQTEGVTDYQAWFREHPDFVARALAAVKIQDVNQWTVDMFQAKDKADLLASLQTVFATPDTLPGFVGELIALAQGQTVYRTEMALNTVQGDRIHTLLAMSFPSPESGGGNVLVSVIDITERRKAEKALRRQAAIIDLSPDAIIVRKLDGTVLSWSRGAETLYGWTQEEARGQQTHLLFQTQFGEPLEKINELIQKAGRWSGELVHRTKDGRTVTVQSWWLAEFDAEGRLVEVVESNIDITERKQMEETLRRSEEKYRNVVENIGIGVTMISPKMEILTLNACMQKWFPHIDARCRPICYESFINPPRSSLCVNCPTCQTLQDGQIHEAIIETPAADKTLYFRVLSSPIKDKDGKVIAATELVEDVTERKRAEEALRASEERMRLFFERQLVGMAFTSPEKGWLKVNDRICEMLGYPREELTRLTWSEMTHPDDLAADTKQFDRLLKGEIESYMLEKRFVRKDGNVVFTNLAVGCVRRADRSVDYVLAMLEDITKRKQAEENIQKLNAELQQRALQLESANQELQRMNKIFVGREIRMVELKEKLKALAKTDTDNETNQTKGKI